MKKILSLVFVLSVILAIGQENIAFGDYISERFIDSTGREVVKIVVPGKPPDHFRMPPAAPSDASYSLPNVPAFDWCFGCSATSAAMMAGYYDRTSYPNMYTGSTNGGVSPMDNSVWGTVVINGETRSQCPFSATRQGLDGRANRGHVDDYWILYGDPGPDPFIVNGWTEHTYGDCTGDYMKTNQSTYNSSDGSTWFYNYTDGSPYSGPGANNDDGMYGIKLFFESRGYTVTSHFNQYIYGYNGNTLGFTFAQFKSEIDAGRPVLIQVSGHTMLGMGYNDTGTLVYLHDTWDYSTHQMTWGGFYSTMQHYAVGVIQLQPIITCNTCPVYDFSIAPSTAWQSHSSSHVASGCKMYRMSVTSGQSYIFKTGCGNGATASYDTYLELYNSSCTLIASDDDDCESNRSIIEWTATYSGYAYLKVRGYGSSAGSYTLAFINSTVPVTRTLQNVTVASGQSLCYDATQTITLAGGTTTFVLQSGGEVNLVAGQNILMLPGTFIHSGGNMMASITTDGSYCFTLPDAMPPTKSVPLIPGMYSIKVDLEKPLESVEINNNK